MKMYCAEWGCDRESVARSKCIKHYRAWWRANRADVVPEHGTISGYTNYACRCAACTAINTEYARIRKNRDKENE
jgi:hypothetical protein